MEHLSVYRTTIFFIACTVSSAIVAHSGGTIPSGVLKGCHNNRKVGGFHCHSKSRFPGRSWSSKAAAEAEVLRKPGSSSKKPKETSCSQYKRSEWEYGSVSKGCLDTRNWVLKERSLTKVSVKGCKVREGKWKDFYYPETLEKASEIEIDHVVPISHAHKTGGCKWSTEKKKQFSNDPQNLVVTNKKYNRQKGANDFTTWSPVAKDYACKYMKRWFEIKNKYKLKVSDDEVSFKAGMKCG